MAAYVVSLLVVIPFIDGDIDRARNYLILLPALPVALAALGLVVLGLLAVIDVKPAAGPWLVFVASMATWGLGATYLTARNS